MRGGAGVCALGECGWSVEGAWLPGRGAFPAVGRVVMGGCDQPGRSGCLGPAGSADPPASFSLVLIPDFISVALSPATSAGP